MRKPNSSRYRAVVCIFIVSHIGSLPVQADVLQQLSEGFSSTKMGSATAKRSPCHERNPDAVGNKGTVVCRGENPATRRTCKTVYDESTGKESLICVGHTVFGGGEISDSECKLDLPPGIPLKQVNLCCDGIYKFCRSDITEADGNKVHCDKWYNSDGNISHLICADDEKTYRCTYRYERGDSGEKITHRECEYIHIGDVESKCSSTITEANGTVKEVTACSNVYESCTTVILNGRITSKICEYFDNSRPLRCEQSYDAQGQLEREVCEMRDGRICTYVYIGGRVTESCVPAVASLPPVTLLKNSDRSDEQ